MNSSYQRGNYMVQGILSRLDKKMTKVQTEQRRVTAAWKKANKNKLYSKETQTPSSFRVDKEVATMLESKKMMFKRDLELVLK